MKKLNINKQEFIVNHSKGLNDKELSLIYNCDSETIRNRRKKWGLDSNFEYKSKLSKETLEKYVNQGLSAYDIAKLENISSRTVYSIIKKYKLVYEDKLHAKPVSLTKEQEEVLVGHVLGDGHLKKIYTNTSGKIEQKDKDYAFWKYSKLCNLCSEFKHWKRKTVDKRTGKLYESYGAAFNANPELNWYYYNFYKKGKKVITNEILDKFTHLSLAVMFMDDGSRTSNTYSIATCCFDQESLKLFQEKLLSWSIHSNIHSNNTTYIKTRSSDLFKHYISPYIIDSMKYKLVT